MGNRDIFNYIKKTKQRANFLWLTYLSFMHKIFRCLVEINVYFKIKLAKYTLYPEIITSKFSNSI